MLETVLLAYCDSFSLFFLHKNIAFENKTFIFVTYIIQAIIEVILFHKPEKNMKCHGQGILAIDLRREAMVMRVMNKNQNNNKVKQLMLGNKVKVEIDNIIRSIMKSNKLEKVSYKYLRQKSK